MPDYVFPPSPQAALPCADGRLFPVRRVFCVGRNYAAHAREMGNDERDPPFFFAKPADAVVAPGEPVPYPPLTGDLHFEIELVIAIGNGGAAIPAERATDHVWGYGVGVDLTRRDLQDIAKKAARPWEWAKGFDHSAPVGLLHPASETGHPARGRIWLSVDGALKQDGDLAEMIWPVAEVVAFCSHSVRLEAGDLIFSGTPAGVGPLQIGQCIEGGVDGVGTIAFTIGERA